MAEDFEEKFIKPIIHASYPATLAALNLTALQVAVGVEWIIKFLLSLGSIMFLLASFSIFFYTIYPTKSKLWTITAIGFLLGLVNSVIAVIVVLIIPPVT